MSPYHDMGDANVSNADWRSRWAEWATQQEKATQDVLVKTVSVQQQMSDTQRQVVDVQSTMAKAQEHSSKIQLEQQLALSEHARTLDRWQKMIDRVIGALITAIVGGGLAGVVWLIVEMHK